MKTSEIADPAPSGDAERNPGLEEAGSPRPIEGGSRTSWFLDWRVYFGIFVTVACVWYAVRDIPLRDVLEAVEEVNFFTFFALSAPFYVFSVYLRALRWRHLTNPIVEIDRPVLFRSTAIGFMVNNLLPLRLGEFVRSFTLAREAQCSMGAVLGTVVLERVLDVVAVLLLAFGSLAYVGMHSDLGGLLQEGSKLLLPVAAAPLVGLLVLRIWPTQTLALTRTVLGPFPERIRAFGIHALESFIDGLAALRGGMHLFWIVLHSVLIWLVASTGPVLVAFWAFDISLGDPLRTLMISWITLGAVGVAVAIPSAPGFIGPYQLAFKAVLVRFGVDPATALAMAMLVWVVFWITLTVNGLLVVRRARLRLSDLSPGVTSSPSIPPGTST